MFPCEVREKLMAQPKRSQTQETQLVEGISVVCLCLSISVFLSLCLSPNPWSGHVNFHKASFFKLSPESHLLCDVIPELHPEIC